MSPPRKAAATAGHPDFPLSEKPRGEREMAPAMEIDEPLEGAVVAEMIAQHVLFLETGGAGGTWTLLSVSGMPLCLYQGAAGKKGKQLVLRLNKIGPGTVVGGNQLSYGDLSGAICREVNFQGATLDHAVAIDSAFDGADFSGASLQGIDFSGSTLTGVSFRDANLTGADFEHTDLTGADFTGANLTNSRFPGAILDGIKR